jgi:hypothetical protein
MTRPGLQEADEQTNKREGRQAMILLLEAPRPEDFPHTLVETLRFADMDRDGHIRSSVFAVCCESGQPLSHFMLASLQLDYLKVLH